MISDPILKEKWRVQKKLAKKSNYDMNKLVEDIHANVEKINKELKIKFKYSDRKGGYIDYSAFPIAVSDKE
jgi:hypothetical protein